MSNLHQTNHKTISELDQNRLALKGNRSPVKDIGELSSDVEGDFEDDAQDIEIDLISDKPFSRDDLYGSSNVPSHHNGQASLVGHIKEKYRDIVHALRDTHHKLEEEKFHHGQLRQDSQSQIAALKTELEALKSQINSSSSIKSSQNESLAPASTSTSLSDRSDRNSLGSPQPTSKSNSKIRDLEKLLAKCKESLKQKNTQIQSLRDSLREVEKFKDYNQELRNELNELREAHETWTVSIAENKRSMHQEIENKNAEIGLIKQEVGSLQSKLIDSNVTIRQLKTNLQDLESRLVSTSAAHQKERETLTRDLNASKAAAIKNVQRHHEIQLERVKLELEKSIESLKCELLRKDEQIISDAKRCNKLESSINYLTKELAETKSLLEESRASIEHYESRILDEQNNLEELERLRIENQALIKDHDEYDLKISELKNEIATLTESRTGGGPDATEFEYLKNIVYQFMLGREPLTLARVISAVFKFEQSQIEQICKVQEAVQSVLSKQGA